MTRDVTHHVTRDVTFEEERIEMTHIAVDTNLPDCAECIELEEILGCEEVWRHLFYLWVWAFEADCQSGIVKLTPALLSRVARWTGESQAFYDAMQKPLGPERLPWLVDKGDGYFYLRGWSRNNRFFKKKEQARERQRKYRETIDAQRDASRNAEGDALRVRDVCPDPSPSPSPSPSHSISHTARSPEQSSDSTPVEFELQLIPKDGVFEITEAMVLEWSESFPGVDVRQEIRKACQWAKDNPAKRKTKKGARRFLGAWMGRVQDRGGGRNQQPRHGNQPIHDMPHLYRDLTAERERNSG